MNSKPLLKQLRQIQLIRIAQNHTYWFLFRAEKRAAHKFHQLKGLEELVGSYHCFDWVSIREAPEGVAFAARKTDLLSLEAERSDIRFRP